MTGALAAHYARALADAVFASSSQIKPEDALQQLQVAAATISGSPQLQKALLSPAVNRDAKSKVLGKISDQLGLSTLIRNFLLVLVKHRRTKELNSIQMEFESEVDRRTGWIPAEITSAQPLSDSERQEIEKALGSKEGRFIRATYRVDEDLLAGIKARVGTTEYDASLRGRLNVMQQRLGAR
jgi:F-type H+-transporting ATPase subunit delta